MFMDSNNIGTFLKTTKTIEIPIGGKRVYRTAAEYLVENCCPQAEVQQKDFTKEKQSKDSLRLSDKEIWKPDGIPAIGNGMQGEREYIYVQVNKENSCTLAVSSPHLVYPAVCKLHEDLQDQDVKTFSEGKIFSGCAKKTSCPL